jgi:hypothetical protein
VAPFASGDGWAGLGAAAAAAARRIAAEWQGAMALCQADRQDWPELGIHVYGTVTLGMVRVLPPGFGETETAKHWLVAEGEFAHTEKRGLDGTEPTKSQCVVARAAARKQAPA